MPGRLCASITVWNGRRAPSRDPLHRDGRARGRSAIAAPGRAPTVQRLRRALLLIDGQAGERQRGELLGYLPHAETALRIVPFVEPIQHAEQPVGGHLNVEIGAKLAALDAFSNDLLPAALILLRGESDHFTKAALYRLALTQIDEEMRIMTIEGFKMRHDRAAQLVGG